MRAVPALLTEFIGCIQADENPSASLARNSANMTETP